MYKTRKQKRTKRPKQKKQTKKRYGGALGETMKQKLRAEYPKGSVVPTFQELNTFFLANQKPGDNIGDAIKFVLEHMGVLMLKQPPQPPPPQAPFVRTAEQELREQRIADGNHAGW